jgi:DNA-binding transcriptional LysR family regulator
MNIAWRAARVTDSQALAGEFADHRELDRRTESLTVNVHGPFVLDDMDVTIRAAMDGSGLRFRLRSTLRRTSQAARSYRVLEDCCSLFAGFFLYYPSRRQQPAALSAPIDTLRLEDRRK